MEKEFITSQEQIIQALVYGVIFLVLLTIGLILFFHFSRKKIIEKEIENIAIELDHQQEILQTSIAIQEAERKRIAQDLHDAISAKLNVVSLTTHTLLDDKGLSKEQKDSLKHILNITTNTLDSSRKIAHDLLPPILDKFGLKVALEELFDEFTQSTKIKIEYEIEEIPSLDKEQELHLFRILQELINNSIKHGKANVLDIKIRQELNGFLLYFKDNGSGFELKNDAKTSGIGLQNIKSRVEILKGEIQINSFPEKGSTFIINCKL